MEKQIRTLKPSNWAAYKWEFMYIKNTMFAAVIVFAKYFIEDRVLMNTRVTSSR